MSGSRAFCATLLNILGKNTVHHFHSHNVSLKNTMFVHIGRHPQRIGGQVKACWDNTLFCLSGKCLANVSVYGLWCRIDVLKIVCASFCFSFSILLFLRNWSCAITNWWPNWTNMSRITLPSVVIIRPCLTRPKCKSLKTHGRMLVLHGFDVQYCQRFMLKFFSCHVYIQV